MLPLLFAHVLSMAVRLQSGTKSLLTLINLLQYEHSVAFLKPTNLLSLTSHLAWCDWWGADGVGDVKIEHNTDECLLFISVVVWRSISHCWAVI